jgi:hypothetical protein
MFRTSHETHYISDTKTNQFMLFKETVADYCQNHTENTNTLFAAEFGVLCDKKAVYIVTAEYLKGWLQFAEGMRT